MIILKIIGAILYALTPLVIMLTWLYLAVSKYNRIGTLSILYLHDKPNCDSMGCEADIWFLLSFIPTVSFVFLLVQIIMILFNTDGYRDDYIGKGEGQSSTAKG